jgi:hypothetical protein
MSGVWLQPPSLFCSAETEATAEFMSLARLPSQTSISSLLAEQRRDQPLWIQEHRALANS